MYSLSKGNIKITSSGGSSSFEVACCGGPSLEEVFWCFLPQKHLLQILLILLISNVDKNMITWFSWHETMIWQENWCHDDLCKVFIIWLMREGSDPQKHVYMFLEPIASINTVSKKSTIYCSNQLCWQKHDNMDLTAWNNDLARTLMSWWSL